MKDVPVDEDGLGLAHAKRSNCRLRTIVVMILVDWPCAMGV